MVAMGLTNANNVEVGYLNPGFLERAMGIETRVTSLEGWRGES